MHLIVRRCSYMIGYRWNAKCFFGGRFESQSARSTSQDGVNFKDMVLLDPEAWVQGTSFLIQLRSMNYSAIIRSDNWVEVGQCGYI